jgi:hypothetical protein
MDKPASLRAFLSENITDFARDPDKLLIYVEEGRLSSWFGASLGYRYHYTLNLWALDYTHDPDTLMLPVLVWLRTHQPDLFLNHEKADEAVSFEVDVLDDKTCDISIVLKLNEAVDVKPKEDGSGYEMTHRPEPPIVGITGMVDPIPILRQILDDKGVLLSSSQG